MLSFEEIKERRYEIRQRIAKGSSLVALASGDPQMVKSLIKNFPILGKNAPAESVTRLFENIFA